MQQLVSITSQGQLTIPKSMFAAFGIKKGAKAMVRKRGDTIIVEPKKDFWSLPGSLKSKVRLSDAQLRAARADFEKSWARKM